LSNEILIYLAILDVIVII